LVGVFLKRLLLFLKFSAHSFLLTLLLLFLGSTRNHVAIVSFGRCGLPADLLHVVKHRGVNAEGAHQHTLVGVPRWEGHTLLPQLSVDLLETWEAIFVHHEGVSPELDQAQGLVLHLLPQSSLFLGFQFPG